MSRRTSAVSFSTPIPTTNGDTLKLSKLTQPSPFATGNGRIHSRSASVSSKLALQLLNDGPSADPDDVFRKYSVAEVKMVQQRLRSDAEAKQEELRQMVGERYRELIQASSSIISISNSSKRVTEALDEIKTGIQSQKQPEAPRRATQRKDDAHLHTLQVLSAHVKLLLDTPEHLWRLIERKEFFSAAWLFLLARVVHRALVRKEEQDELNASSQSLDIVEQFPLIQRQWDTVSQFRSQIIHKSTMALKEYLASVEHTSEIILTLHLLDSRPLTDTLSVLLAQRYKTFLALTSRNPGSRDVTKNPASSPSTGPSLERALSRKKSQAKAQNKPTREIIQAAQAALDVITQTARTARRLFQRVEDQEPLIVGALKFIQADSLVDSIPGLPLELQLTTEILLGTLPSSTHFHLLPLNLRSYKPYVDLNSSSTHVTTQHFIQSLDEWFHKCVFGLKTALERWLVDVQTVKEVWWVRKSLRKAIHDTELLEGEVTQLRELLDDVCRTKIVGIWEANLGSAERNFKEKLESAVSTLTEAGAPSRSPVSQLFQAPPLPVLLPPQSGAPSGDAVFSKYKATLRQQLVGRTALLNEVLETIETCARALQRDLTQVLAAENDDSRVLVERLAVDYRPYAHTLCRGILDALTSTSQVVLESETPPVIKLVFLSRVTDELSTSSPFTSFIGCKECKTEEFRGNTKSLHNRIVDRWRAYTVTQIVNDNRPSRRTKRRTRLKGFEPSPRLTCCLLSLSSSLLDVSVAQTVEAREDLACETLSYFVKIFLELPESGTIGENDERNEEGEGKTFEEKEQFHASHELQDLVFLRKLVDVWGGRCGVAAGMLNEAISKVGGGTRESTLDADVSESLARTQTLFAALLPSLTGYASIVSPVKSPTTPSFGADDLGGLLQHGKPRLER